jgi:enoyl-CoA hydratase/carnithine racemase
VRATKDIVDALVEESLELARDNHRAWRQLAGTSGEAAEGITAFVERRSPAFSWTGPR